ncbi:MAG: phospho-sugar mutase [Oscillospiraceae bacterium]|nr:phospho-sugar mutase [Oscillospiraceae bacterium]
MLSDKKSDAQKMYERWLATVEGDLLGELESIKGDNDAISDRFFRPLGFGTGGLRGVIGAGTNRMNIHTVGLATQALADWMGHTGSAAIAYDSRDKSDVFAKAAACVLAANGVTAHIFGELQPTPALSYAVRKLGCGAGVVITASHNPSIYNGYKCYGPDGCQMTDNSAGEVEEAMAGLDIFDDVKFGGFGDLNKNFDDLMSRGLIKFIPDDFIEGYLDEVQKSQVEPDAAREAGLSVIYTPLCGAGNVPVRKILARIGVEAVVVPEQEHPDGDFPRCPFPNPEIREAFDAALELAEFRRLHEMTADLLLATDPDADRVGIAVWDGGKYRLMSGNEVGALMLHYLLSRRNERGTLPEKPVAVRSIVTSAIADRIAADYGCELRVCLTGFKYIGEIMTELEKAGEESRFVLGYEESYGYLTGNYARDKDAVLGAMIICEMAAFYKLGGKTLLDVMEEIYGRYGCYAHRQVNKSFEGESGMRQMTGIMQDLREHKPAEIADGVKVVGWCDYLESKRARGGESFVIDLPKSNVLEFECADGSILTARPSGTEPKIKFYLTAAGDSHESSKARLDRMETYVRREILKEV